MNGAMVLQMFQLGTIDIYLDQLDTLTMIHVLTLSQLANDHVQTLDTASEIDEYLSSIEYPDVDHSLYAQLGLE